MHHLYAVQNIYEPINIFTHSSYSNIKDHIIHIENLLLFKLYLQSSFETRNKNKSTSFLGVFILDIDHVTL